MEDTSWNTARSFVCGKRARKFAPRKRTCMESSNPRTSRWELDKTNLPLYSLAYALTPFFYSDNWLTSFAPDGGQRRKPHADPKVYLDVVDRLVRDSKEASVVRQQLMNAGRAESLLYVDFNQRLLTNYLEDYEGYFRNWDYFVNDDNLEIDMDAIEDSTEC